MSALGHSRPGPAGRRSNHVRYAPVLPITANWRPDFRYGSFATDALGARLARCPEYPENLFPPASMSVRIAGPRALTRRKVAGLWLHLECLIWNATDGSLMCHTGKYRHGGPGNSYGR